jgi:addiction module HigA family antidote
MLPSARIATHPGQVLLKEFLDPLKLTQADLARAICIPQNRINELIRGKRGVSPETALLLSGYFKNSPEFWMNLQSAHDLTKARAVVRKRPISTSRGRTRSLRRTAGHD